MRGEGKRWRKPSLAVPLNWVTAVMICRLSTLFHPLLFHFLLPPPFLPPLGLQGVFIFLMSRWFFFLLLLLLLSLPHSFWMEGNICHSVSPAIAWFYMECGGAKWCKVFMSWFSVGVGGWSARRDRCRLALIAPLHLQPYQYATQWANCTWLDWFNWPDPKKHTGG